MMYKLKKEERKKNCTQKGDLNHSHNPAFYYIEIHNWKYQICMYKKNAGYLSYDISWNAANEHCILSSGTSKMLLCLTSDVLDTMSSDKMTTHNNVCAVISGWINLKMITKRDSYKQQNTFLRSSSSRYVQ